MVNPIKPFERIELKFSELERQIAQSVTVGELKEIKMWIEDMELRVYKLEHQGTAAIVPLELSRKRPTWGKVRRVKGRRGSKA